MDEDVRRKLVNYLKTCNDSKSEFSKIKSELDLEKKVLNRQLYILKHKNIVKRLQESPPIWQLTEKAAGNSPKKSSPNKTSPKLQSAAKTGNIHPESRSMSNAGPVNHVPTYNRARGRSRNRGGRGQFRAKWVGKERRVGQKNQQPNPSTHPLSEAPGTSQIDLQSEVLNILCENNEPLTERGILSRIGHYVKSEHVNEVLEKLMKNDKVVKIDSHDSSMDTFALKLSVANIGGSHSSDMEFEYGDKVSDEARVDPQPAQMSVVQKVDDEMNNACGSCEEHSQESHTSREQNVPNPEFTSLGFEPTLDQVEDYMDEDYDDYDDYDGFSWNTQNTFTDAGELPEYKTGIILKALLQCPLGIARLFILASKIGKDMADIENDLKRLLNKGLVEKLDKGENLWGISDKGKTYLKANEQNSPNVVHNPINLDHKSDTSHINQHNISSVSAGGPPKPPMELLRTDTVFNLSRSRYSEVPDNSIGTEHSPKMSSGSNSTKDFPPYSLYTGIGRGQQLRAMISQASQSQHPHDLFTGTSEKKESFASAEILPSPKLTPYNLASSAPAMMHVNPSVTSVVACSSRAGTFPQNPGNPSKQTQLPGGYVKPGAPLPPIPTTIQPSSSASASKAIPLTPKQLLSNEENGTHNKGIAKASEPSTNNQALFPLPSSYQRSQDSNLASSPSASSPVTTGVQPVFPSLSGLTNNLSINTESFSAVNKNPISALMEYAQSRHLTAKIEVVSQQGPPHKPKFIIAAIIGDRVFPGVKASNKKDGRTEAADLALRTLLSEGQYKVNQQKTVASTPNANMTHFDKMAALSHQAFNQLIATIPEKFAGRKVIAALIMKTSPDDTGTVISVGSGNRCITGEQLSLEGNTVNDSHAEIITRRGFLRFLYKQLETYSGDKDHQLFEDGGDGKLRIKSTITFHLYISTAPCGDGALFSPRDAASNRGAIEDVENHHHQPTYTSNVQGLLRTKMEGGEGTIPIESDFTVQTWDGIIRGERLRTMSCTDKICRWNIVGLQGALLSHFFHPVYLNSLTLGYLYDHGHLARAVCCRAGKGEPDISTQLPSDYHLNHPWLGRMTACEPQRETQKTKALSINWCHGDERPEVIDGTQGRCYTGVEKYFFSRICKKELFQKFKSVCSKFRRSDLVNISTYLDSKRKATDFQAAKDVMVKRLKDNGFGTWVSKPVEEEMFSGEPT